MNLFLAFFFFLHLHLHSALFSCLNDHKRFMMIPDLPFYTYSKYLYGQSSFSTHIILVSHDICIVYPPVASEERRHN
jgi:hypothetical protein